jgi:FkbM family methyltransferase
VGTDVVVAAAAAIVLAGFSVAAAWRRWDARYPILLGGVLFVVASAFDLDGRSDWATSLEVPVAGLLLSGAALALWEWEREVRSRARSGTEVRSSWPSSGGGIRRPELLRRLRDIVNRFGPVPIPVYRAALRALVPFRTELVEVDGLRFHLDRGDAMHLSTLGAHESYALRLLLEYLRPGDLFIDIGAHIGYYSLHAARTVGMTGRVIAFEPDPENAELLSRNAAENDLRGIRIERVALGDRAGVGTLYLSSTNRGDHRLDATDEPRTTVEVPVVPLDEALASESVAPRALKIDAQGSEARIWEGMARVLSTEEPLAILLEFWPYGLRRAGADPPAFLRRIEADGFVVREIDEHKTRLRDVDATELLARLGERPDAEVNLLLARARRRGVGTGYGRSGGSDPAVNGSGTAG